MPVSNGTLQRGELEPVVYQLDPEIPLKWEDALSHHKIDKLHLWIGVDQGILIVLDEKQNSIFQHLLNGLSPSAILNMWCQGKIKKQQIYDKWQAIRLVIARIAKAGFIDGVDGRRDVRQSSPGKFARLHITRRCQLRCIHCYAMSGPHIDSATEMPPDQWRQLIEEIAETGGKSVLFTGGEPLIRNSCTSLIRHAKRQRLKVTLFTNGLLVGKHLDAFKNHVDLVQVSLNGPDKTTNDPIRGKGTFQAATNAVDLLVEACVPVRIGITVMEQNWPALRDRFQQLVGRYEGTGVAFHLGYGLCSHGRAKSIDDRLDLQQIRAELDDMRTLANGIQPEIIARKTVNCGYCEQLVVASDGQVYPCHLLEGALGHIWDKPIRGWHTTLSETARLHRVDKLQTCSDCDLRNLCGGTCRVINHQETGSKLISTCSKEDRNARYQNLVRMFNDSGLTAVSVID